ncbi:MAG: tripartite tricarboxylate transporter substrate binding protein [Desulfopila sp.]|jgi:tripartite-type tricarboxylate transporter receptor subunit TctC|nr:tripartite tricarboxylate transporter substrate binding protein [Desulfopila sp.]
MISILKKFLSVSTLTVCLAVSGAFCAIAEEYPSKPIKFLIPFNPGGQSDVAVLFLKPGLEEYLGVDIVPQHRPGGGGAVGWTMLAQQKPDGYMMAVTNLPHIVMQPIMTEGVQYETSDLAPVYLYASSPGGVAVRADDDRFKTLEDLVAYSKKNPKKLSIGGTGKFTGNHLGFLQFTQLADIDASYVSFNGAAPQTAGLLGGHVDAIYGGTFIFSNNREKIRVLAVATDERLADFPDVPTLKEKGYDMESGIDRGVTVPAGTPQDRIDKLAKALAHASKNTDFIEGMEKLGFRLLDIGPEEYAKFIQARKDQYTKVLKQAGLLQ